MSYRRKINRRRKLSTGRPTCPRCTGRMQWRRPLPDNPYRWNCARCGWQQGSPKQKAAADPDAT